MVFQDFQNDYTEVDDDAKLVATLTKIDWTTFERDDNGYFHRDFGANFFDDFDIVWDFELSDVEAGDASNQNFVGLLTLGNAVSILPADAIRILARQVVATDDIFIIRFTQRTGGGTDFTTGSGNLAINTTYYARLRRTGTTVELDIYSTNNLRIIGAGGDVADLDDGGAGNTADYRYCMATVGMDNATDGTDHSTGWLDNLDLDFGVAAVAPVGSVASSALIARVI